MLACVTSSHSFEMICFVVNVAGRFAGHSEPKDAAGGGPYRPGAGAAVTGSEST